MSLPRSLLGAPPLLLLLLLPFAAPPGAAQSLDPPLHRETLRANADRAATLEAVSRDPRRFRGVPVAFEGRLQAVKESTERGRTVTRLLLTHGPLAFSCNLPGPSARYLRGQWLEVYGRLWGTADVFGTGRIPHVDALRALTPDDIARDGRTAKDLDVAARALREGGYLRAGRAWLDAGRPADALLAFDLGLRYDRRESLETWHYEAGRALHALGRLDEARTRLEASLRGARRDPDARLLLGRILLDLGDPETAARHLRRADSLKRSGDSLKYLARAEAGLGDGPAALRHLDLARELAPRDDEILRDRAVVAERLGYVEAAARDLSSFLERHPDDARAAGLLAECRRRLNIHRAAERADARLEYDNALASTLETLGSTHDPLRPAPPPEDLLARLEAAEKKNPGKWRLENALGLALLHAGRFDEAAARFRRAGELAPYLPDPRWNLGHALRRAGDLHGALAAFEEALRLDPLMERAGRHAGLVARALDFEASRDFRPSGAERAVFHRELGDLLAARGETEDAMFEYLEASRHDPNETRALLKLARLLRRHDRIADAEGRLRELFRRSPGHPDAVRELEAWGYSPHEIRALGGARSR